MRAFVRRTLHPKTKLGKTTLWFGYLAAALEFLRIIFRPGSGSMLGGWSSFISFVFLCFAFLMGLRWLRRVLMWRLRNRLIVTYVFIGVIPVILLVGMGVDCQLSLCRTIRHLRRHVRPAIGAAAPGSHQPFAGISVSQPGESRQSDAGACRRNCQRLRRELSSPLGQVWDGDQGFVLSESGRVAATGPIKPSSWLKNDFAGFVLDDHRLQMRVVKRLEEGAHHLTVISNLPITPELLRNATAELGSITFYSPDQTKLAAASGRDEDWAAASR